MANHSRNGAFSGKRCLILGGGGFLGTHLTRRLLEIGAEVTILGHSVSFPDEIEGAIVLRGDFTDPAVCDAALREKEIVFHLVSTTVPKTSQQNIRYDIESNLIGTVSLLDACVREGIAHIVYVSSGGTVYGQVDCTPIPETAPTHPINSYGITKLAAEKYIQMYGSLYGLGYTILRLSNPYGPLQLATKNQGVIAVFADRALRGIPVEIWGDGRNIRDYIYIDDVVDAMVAATSTRTTVLANIGSGVGYSLLDVLNCLESILEHPIPRYHHDARSIDVPNNVLDIRLAQSKFRWAPQIDLQSGVLRTVEWLRLRNR